MANAIWQATIVDQSGNVLPGAEVEVVNEETGLSAPLFTTRTGTAKSNPFFADANGFAQFYAAPGLYRITATGAGTGTTMTWRNVRLVELANDAEVQAGTDTSLAVTPAALSSRTATETRTGLIELATNAEVQAGTDTDRAVTPAGLASRTATETRTGLVEKATNQEALDGVVDKFPDAAGVKAAISAAVSGSVITGSCTTNGTTDNTLVLTGIVTALALEVGDVIQITGSTGGLNDKLFTVETITDDDSIIVNYEHAGNRGNGSLKLADETATVTIKRIAKWYNAPVGLGQAWVSFTPPTRQPNVIYTNTTGRCFEVQLSSATAENQPFVVDGITIGTNPAGSIRVPWGVMIGEGSSYRFSNSPNTSILYWSELR